MLLMEQTAIRTGMSHLKTTLLMSALMSVLWTGPFPETALAEARVEVQLKDAEGKPAEGVVSLHAKDGAKIASCKTSRGKCEMTGVPGGNYEVRVQPDKGEAPKPRSAMIPPEGTAKLIVSTANKGS
jgi:hypothetical protein